MSLTKNLFGSLIRAMVQEGEPQDSQNFIKPSVSSADQPLRVGSRNINEDPQAWRIFDPIKLDEQRMRDQEDREARVRKAWDNVQGSTNQ